MTRAARNRFVIVTCTFLVTVGSACADETAVATDLDSWIEQLGDSSFVQRDYAARQIRDHGREVIPALESRVTGNDVTAAIAAIDLLERLAVDQDLTVSSLAHAALSKLAASRDQLPESQQVLVRASLRRAQRHAIGLLAEFRAEIQRDESLRITEIQVSHTQFSDEQMPVFAGMKHLKSLDLRTTEITDEAMAVISQLPALEELNLSDTQVTIDGLLKLQSLPQLTKLHIYRVRLSPSTADAESDSIQRLIKALPRCDIRF